MSAVEQKVEEPLRSKRGKKRPRPPTSEDFVKVVPLKIQDDPNLPVQISKARRGKNAKVSPDCMTFSSAAGYRSVQSNRGVYTGTWYFEINVTFLGETGHARLGVGTARQEIDAPCGYTSCSFGYRDVDGSKVHKAERQPYGAPYKEGDTVGVLIHLPEGGKPHEIKTQIVRWHGRLYQTEDTPTEKPKPLAGSFIGYAVNGAWQGKAYEDFLEGTYYAAASLFTAPKPEKMASLAFNFGPDFKFSPPDLSAEGIPNPMPFCEAKPPPISTVPSGGLVTVENTAVAVIKEEEKPQEQPDLANQQALVR